VAISFLLMGRGKFPASFQDIVMEEQMHLVMQNTLQSPYNKKCMSQPPLISHTKR